MESGAFIYGSRFNSSAATKTGARNRLRLETGRRRVTSSRKKAQLGTIPGARTWTLMLLLIYNSVFRVSRDCSAKGSSPTRTHVSVHSKKRKICNKDTHSPFPFLSRFSLLFYLFI